MLFNTKKNVKKIQSVIFPSVWAMWKQRIQDLRGSQQRLILISILGLSLLHAFIILKPRIKKQPLSKNNSFMSEGKRAGGYGPQNFSIQR